MSIAIGAIPVQASDMSQDIELSKNELSKNIEQQVLKIIRDHPEVILESVQKYRRDQELKQRQVQADLLQTIKTNPQSFIQKSPRQGSVDYKLLLIEFSDFQCPYCAQVHTTLKRFVAHHPDEVAWVYKHFPLDQIHSEAMAAAAAAWAANRQGYFWQYHDFLFEHQNQLGESLYIEGAELLGLNLNQFNRNRNSKEAIASIQSDIELAEKLGITGTPFFIINGDIFSGAIQESLLEKMLENKLSNV